MLSGGPDSALILKEVLEQTQDPVVALHVSFVLTSRWEQERKAANDIVKTLSARIRPFIFETAAIKPCGKFADMPVLGVFAAMLCNKYGDIGKTWVGEDIKQDDGAVDKAFCEVRDAAIFRKRFPDTHFPIEHHPPLGVNRSKAQIRAALGEELWALCWSCREPGFNGQPCGQCESCEERVGL